MRGKDIDDVIIALLVKTLCVDLVLDTTIYFRNTRSAEVLIVAISWSNYTEFHRPSGLYYKMVRDGRGDPHLLCSGDERSLRRESVVVHDHYWKRGGRWYVQIRKGREHLLEDNTAFDSIAPGVGKSLDEVLRKLGG